MANYVISESKCFIDVTTAVPCKMITNVNGSQPLTVLVPTLPNGVSIYALDSCDDSIYPVEIESTNVTDMAIVTVTKIENPSFNISSIAKIEFEHGSDVYVCEYKNTAAVGASVTAWVGLSPNE